MCGTHGIVGIDEGVIDGDNIDLAVLHTVPGPLLAILLTRGRSAHSRIAEDDTANAAKTVDTDESRSHIEGFW